MTGKIEGYKLIRKVGDGGMASVYLAEQQSLSRKVAIKLLKQPPKSASGDDSAVTERFMQEARLIAQLDHPAIVNIHDFGTTEKGELFYVMPYLDFGDFRALQWETDEELAEHLIALCNGLAYAHEKGVVHRDIKPQNLLLDRQGRPLITDFGIAWARKKDKRITMEGVTVGSCYYMSPEQARGFAVDARSDIYSLGAVVFEALTGRVPYDAEDDFSVLLAHLNDPIPRLPPELSGAWQGIIERCLQKNPADRYQNMGDLISDLQAVAEGKAGTPTGRRWFVPLLGTTLLAAAATLLFFLLRPPGEDTVADAPPRIEPQSSPPVTTPPALPDEATTETFENTRPEVDPAEQTVLVSDEENSPETNADPPVEEPSVERAFEDVAAEVWTQVESGSPADDTLFAEFLAAASHDAANPDTRMMLRELGEALAVAAERHYIDGSATTAARTINHLERMAMGAWISSSDVRSWSKLSLEQHQAIVKDVERAESSRLAPSMVYTPAAVSRKNGGTSRLSGPIFFAAQEVTRGGYRAFAEETGQADAECRAPGDLTDVFRKYTWKSPGFEQMESHPAVCVSWHDAVAYAAWLSRKTGANYRLPTEAEWRHVASVADPSGSACESGNVAGTELDRESDRIFSCADGYVKTAPVGTFVANDLGIFDLRGNVQEWTANCPPRPPKVVQWLDNVGMTEADRCARRTARGTSWSDGNTVSMRANASYYDPARGYSNVGIRLVRDPLGDMK